jgi:hypothetical protein
MKDQEILEKRAELQARSKAVRNEWQAYDKRYPVLPGAYRPPDYDRQQRMFLDRLRLCPMNSGPCRERLERKRVWS